MDARTGIEYAILIKAYGKVDRTDQETRLWHDILLQDHPAIQFDLSVCNALVYAWSQSSQLDAVDQALAVLKTLEHNPKCLERWIRPNVITYSGVLKCLARSQRVDAGIQAVAIIDTMESRFQVGDLWTQPDTIAYTLASEACLRARDYPRADAISERMEQSRKNANTSQTANDSLQPFFLIVGATEAMLEIG